MVLKSKTSFVGSLREGLYQPNLPGIKTSPVKSDRVVTPKFPETDDEARAQGYRSLEDFQQEQHLSSIMNEGVKSGWRISAIEDGKRQIWTYPDAKSENDAVAQFHKEHPYAEYMRTAEGDGPFLTLREGTEEDERKVDQQFINADDYEEQQRIFQSGELEKDLKEDHLNHQPEPTVTVVGEKDGQTESVIFDGRDENAAKEEFLRRFPGYKITKCELEESKMGYSGAKKLCESLKNGGLKKSWMRGLRESSTPKASTKEVK